MERRIEGGELGNFGMEFQAFPNPRQLHRVMEGRQGDALLNFCQGIWIDRSRLGKVTTPMDHPVANPVEDRIGRNLAKNPSERLGVGKARKFRGFFFAPPVETLDLSDAVVPPNPVDGSLYQQFF
jgi:hypothetical protein